MADKPTIPDADDILAEAKAAFERADQAEADNRQTALDDIKFARAGEQWPSEIQTQRQRESRPCLTINKLKAYIRQVVNDARQNKPAIKTHPVDSGADPETAKVIDGLIRNIEYTSNADVAYDTAVECAVSGGFGYWRVTLDYAYDDAFEMDLGIKRISNPFSVYGDPDSRAADSSDWDVAFLTDRISKKQYEREYKGAEKVDWDSSAWSGLNGTAWLNDDGVLTAEYWTREHVDEDIQLFIDKRTGKPIVLNQKSLQDPDNLMLIQTGMLEFRQTRRTKTCKVVQRMMSGAEILPNQEGETDRPWPGRYIPIIPVYGDEFDIEGKRYWRSLIHDAIDAQRMFNYWRTNATELVALAPRVPFIGPKGAFDTDPGWQTANTQSHPYLEYDGQVAPQRQPLDMGAAAGSMQEALVANDDIKAIIGMYDASLGARSNETSGRAIMARQREGDVSTFHFIDNLSRAIKHTGRILIDLIPHVYTGPRIIRVIGEDGSQKSQPVNQQSMQMGKDGKPEVDDDTGQAIMALHDLTTGKYDLTVEAGPSFTTRREEAAYQITEAIRAFPQGSQVLLPILAKNSDWPGADEIAEKLEKMQEGQLPPEVQKMIEQGKAEMGKLQEALQKAQTDRSADLAKIQADKEVKLAGIQVDKEVALARDAADRAQPPKPPSVSIAYKDMPPEAQSQALAQAGLQVDPATIAEHAYNLAQAGTQGAVLKPASNGAKPTVTNGSAEMVRAVEMLAKVMAAPNELVRDPATGKAIGSRKALVQ